MEWYQPIHCFYLPRDLKFNIAECISTSARLVFIGGQNVSKTTVMSLEVYHGRNIKWKHLGSAVLVLQPVLPRSPRTVNGVQCAVGAAAIQTDYSCHCWSTWNGWPLPKWSQAAYKCSLYKRSAGGQSAWDRYLMETSGVYCRLHGER